MADPEAPCPECGRLRRVRVNRTRMCRACATALKLVPTQSLDDWVEQAACRLASNPDAFFGTAQHDVEYAIEHCRACPVRRECLDYAMKNKELYGVWGMTTPHMRGITYDAFNKPISA